LGHQGGGVGEESPPLFSKSSLIEGSQISKAHAPFQLVITNFFPFNPMHPSLVSRTSPPKIADHFFHDITHPFRDQKTAHYVGMDGLGHIPDEGTSPSKREIIFFHIFKFLPYLVFNEVENLVLRSSNESGHS
jgi:hypothetical protein